MLLPSAVDTRGRTVCRRKQASPELCGHCSAINILGVFQLDVRGVHASFQAFPDLDVYHFFELVGRDGWPVTGPTNGAAGGREKI